MGKYIGPVRRGGEEKGRIMIIFTLCGGGFEIFLLICSIILAIVLFSGWLKVAVPQAAGMRLSIRESN